MNQNEIIEYLKRHRMQWKTMFDIATLQTYANFDIGHVRMLRPKTSLNTIEQEIVDGKHDVNLDLAKGIVVGLAFPTNEGYILLGNEYTIIVLLDKRFEQQQLLVMREFREGVGFEDFTGSYDPDDYLFSRVDKVDPIAQKHIEDWWFKESKPAYQSKLN